ncbi:MAG TPA: glycosyl hydrolase family 8 [Candidatus Saccharimonadales bacterium]
MKQFPRPLIVGVIIAIAAVVALLLLRTRSNTSSSPPATPAALAAALWQNYQQHYWDANTGQTTDPRTNTTTSEAQSYTMLRAVWSDDQTAFQKTWQWTSQHMQRSDKLFSWQWGKRPDGTEGILTGNGGQNTASDADTDIALALILAANRWHDAAYGTAASAIVPSIWEQEVVIIQGEPYLTADNLEKNSPAPLLNPSYFAPYAYRIFAAIDPGHPWDELAGHSYTTLQAASQKQLGSRASAGLPPDWVQIDRATGSLSAAKGHDTDFGFDALRVVWRTALDYAWNDTASAKNALASFSALDDDWNHDHKLYAIYHHSGQPAVNYSSTAMYGGTLGYFSVIHPQTAKTIYDSQLAPLYDPATHRLTKTLNYYDNNWAWFGAALYGHLLPKPSLAGGLYK